MPQVTAEAWVPVPPELAFAVSQTTGEVRLRWDPFIRHQHLVDADRPAKGVETVTKARVGPTMVSRYVSYRPPTSVGMTMVRGPWFFASFGGGWRFTPEARDGVAGTRVLHVVQKFSSVVGSAIAQYTRSLPEVEHHLLSGTPVDGEGDLGDRRRGVDGGGVLGGRVPGERGRHGGAEEALDGGHGGVAEDVGGKRGAG